MNRVNGFSMIEVLITLLLISIGVLGMVALQGRTIGYTQDSIQRNAAANLANDLMEMIRIANPAGLPTTSGFYKSAAAAFPSLPADGCGTTTTTASEQLACWSDRASRLLPGATDLLSSKFYVCISGTPGSCTAGGSAVEIQLAWTAKAGECLDGTQGSTCTYRLRADL